MCVASLAVSAGLVAVCGGQLFAQSDANAVATELESKITEVGEAGEIKLQNGDAAGAAQDFKQAFEWSQQLAENENAYFYLSRLAQALTVAGDFPNAVKMQERAARGYKNLSATTPSDETEASAATAIGALAWYQILNNNPQAAGESAREALALDARQIWVKSNLAHALLLTGKVKEAKAIYRAEQSTLLPGHGLTFEQFVLGDFVQMEKAGIRDPRIEQIRALYGAPKRTDFIARHPTLLVCLIAGGSLLLIGAIVALFGHFGRKHRQTL